MFVYFSLSRAPYVAFVSIFFFSVSFRRQILFFGFWEISHCIRFTNSKIYVHNIYYIWISSCFMLFFLCFCFVWFALPLLGVRLREGWIVFSCCFFGQIFVLCYIMYYIYYIYLYIICYCRIAMSRFALQPLRFQRTKNTLTTHTEKPEKKKQTRRE